MTKLTQDRLNPLLVSDKPLTTIEEASAAHNKLVNQINFQLIPALDKNSSKIALDATYMASIQYLEAADQIAHTYNTLPLEGEFAAVTLTSTPTITDGYDGERLLLIGMDDTKTVTIQDESNLTSSNLQNIGGANITLKKGNIVGYIFSEQTGYWEQMFQKTDDMTIAGNLTIGSGAADTDYTLTFDGETNDGVLTWMEDEDYFKFDDDVNLNTLTASQAVFTDASRTLVSNAITGTGNVVMSASPTLTGTIVAAALDMSGALNVAGVTTLDTTTAGALVIGAGTAGVDYNITFNGETNDGVLTWMEDEARFVFDNAVDVDATVTDAAANWNAVDIEATVSPTGANSREHRGFSSQNVLSTAQNLTIASGGLIGSAARIINNNTGTITLGYGTRSTVLNNTSGIYTKAVGVGSDVQKVSTGSITTAIGFQSLATNVNANNSIGTMIGFSDDIAVNTGTITDRIGVQLASTASATNNWALDYSSDFVSGESIKVTPDGGTTTKHVPAANATGISGTLTIDDGANWNVALTFSAGILTGQTIGASSGATATWV